MRFSISLIALVASSALAMPTSEAKTAEHAMQKQKCFETGENWGGDRSNAENRAIDFCFTVADKNISADRSSHLCYNLSDTKKVDFTLKNIGGADRELDFNECFDGFKKEINGCDRGGATSYVHWRYTADPNPLNYHAKHPPNLTFLFSINHELAVQLLPADPLFNPVENSTNLVMRTIHGTAI
ncbi:hypothetical protein OQA88_634 [Cercophora sp. LCS_1]